MRNRKDIMRELSEDSGRLARESLFAEILLDIRDELVKSRKPLIQIEPTKLSKEQVEKLLAE